MALPRPEDTEPLRRRFPHFSPQLMEMLEACLQVGGSVRSQSVKQCWMSSLNGQL